jgi:acetyl esterase/lipase
MNKLISTLIIVFLFAITFRQDVKAQEMKQPAPRKSMAEIVNTPVVYKIAGTERAKVKKDLNYKTVETNPPLKMDVYSPPDLAKNEKRPAVIFIHGGAGAEYNPKNWGVYVSWGKLAAATGFVGVTFTHRLGFPKTLVTEAAADVGDAINYVRANADALNVDKDRICLASYSAGGPMLSLAMREKPEYVRCLVAFYSFLDVRQSTAHRENETPETLQKFSPITYLDENAAGLPPMFIARAGLDEIPTMNDSIDRFVREALAKNANVELMNHPAGVHGFDNQTDDERSREIIGRALEFMHKNLDAESKKSVDEARDLLIIEQKRGAAIVKHDMEFLHKLYADDFRGITATGYEVDKTRLMEVFKLDDPNTKFIIDEMQARVFENTAIITGRLTGRTAAGEIISRSKFIHVYLRRGGQWRIIAGQGTPVRAATRK